MAMMAMEGMIQPSSAYFWLNVRTPAPTTSLTMIAAMFCHGACCGGAMFASRPSSSPLFAEEILEMLLRYDAQDLIDMCTDSTLSLSTRSTLPNRPLRWTTSTFSSPVGGSPPYPAIEVSLFMASAMSMMDGCPNALPLVSLPCLLRLCAEPCTLPSPPPIFANTNICFLPDRICQV